MTDNPIVVKTLAFALRIVKLSRYLADTHKEFTLSREVLSSGTNIGKFVVSAVGGDSRESFTANMSKALQKADETEYWLRLIQFAEYISDKEYGSIEADRKEIAMILTKIVKTSKEEL